MDYYAIVRNDTESGLPEILCHTISDFAYKSFDALFSEENRKSGKTKTKFLVDGADGEWVEFNNFDIPTQTTFLAHGRRHGNFLSVSSASSVLQGIFGFVDSAKMVQRYQLIGIEMYGGGVHHLKGFEASKL